MNARLIAFAAVAAFSIAPAFASHGTSDVQKLLGTSAPQISSHCAKVLASTDMQGTGEYRYCQNEI